MKIFTTETMQTILEWVQNQETDTIAFEVLNPDAGESRYAGSIITLGGIDYRHRSYKAWSDLAEILFCRMLTPEKETEHTVIIRFQKINLGSSFHKSKANVEKYGVDSEFFALQKSEEPAFLAPYLRALDAVKIQTRARILNLGINRGDEFEVIRSHIGDAAFNTKTVIGIDHSSTAIVRAKSRFPSAAFHVEDINNLDSLQLERSDLLISIGTLQSPGINFKPFFMSLVQNHLTSDGAIILGFPNCRWMDGEMIYGAKAPNYSYSEQSLLYNDVIFCKKYLQQKKFRVTLTGKDYLFLTATKIGKTTFLKEFVCDVRHVV